MWTISVKCIDQRPNGRQRNNVKVHHHLKSIKCVIKLHCLLFLFVFISSIKTYHIFIHPLTEDKPCKHTCILTLPLTLSLPFLFSIAPEYSHLAFDRHNKTSVYGQLHDAARTTYVYYRYLYVILKTHWSNDRVALSENKEISK